MAEYVPVIPGSRETYKASADITGGKLVSVSGVGTVATAGAKDAAAIGVAATDVKTNGSVTVYGGGVQTVLASGAVTAGDVLVAGAAGTVAKLAAVGSSFAQADVTDSRAIVGIALSTGTDVPVRVKFLR